MEATYPEVERRHHQCPVENCKEVSALVEKNKELNTRIRNVGITALTIASLMMTILLFMSNNTLDIAQDTAAKMNVFIEGHNQAMVRDENIHATLIANMNTQQTQMRVVTDIQREVIQEVSILKKARVR